MASQAMTTTRHDDAALMEQVLLGGNLANLTPQQRLSYYRAVCDSIGLNPLTKPFDYLTLNGRLVLYAKKDATDQLRDRRKVSITRLEHAKIEGVYTVTAYARSADGRQDSSIGAVSVEGLRGDALANAIMKAETKSKRRVTLSICGLGMLDETEIESIPNAATVTVDTDTGEIVEAEVVRRETPTPARTRTELVGEWVALVDKAVALGIALDRADITGKPDATVAKWVDALRAKVQAAEEHAAEEQEETAAA
jgi:hypothetical protein